MEGVAQYDPMDDHNMSYLPDEMGAEGETSDIQNFFAGASVFVTGGTGFMGQVLLEKLLRSCPDLNRIYVMARPKKGKTMQQRLDELYDGPLFSRLKTKYPKALNKVTLMEGDVGSDDLGLTNEDRETIRREVHVIFHVAATVRFDEILRTAVAINIVGTSTLLALAREMQHLKAYVHVSTAYSNCPLKSIDEEFYPTTIDREKLVKLCDSLDDAQLEILKPSLLGKWPNTYVYTKAVAEDVIKKEGQGLPIAIIRPSIVVSTAREPIRGWINNLYGATGVSTGASVGLIKTLHCDANILADIVPVDMTINCAIAAAWDAGKNRSNLEVVPPVDNISIYNYVSSPQRPITWGEYMRYSEKGLLFPTMHVMWAYCLTLNKYAAVNLLYMLFLHTIPAIIVDGFTLLVGGKPRLWKTYKKVHKFSKVIEYFSTQQWKFKNLNVQRLWSSLGERDKLLFHFNMAELDWADTIHIAIRGIRIYLLHDPLETIPAARKRFRKLMWLHNTVKFTALLLVVSITYWILAPWL